MIGSKGRDPRPGAHQQVFMFGPSGLYLGRARDFRSCKRKIRKLSFFILDSKLNKQLVCFIPSFSKLIRMICVILSFQIGSNLVGTCTRVVSSFCFQPIGKSFGSHISGDIIILVKKSAFNNWSYNRFKFEVSIRV